MQTTIISVLAAVGMISLSAVILILLYWLKDHFQERHLLAKQNEVDAHRFHFFVNKLKANLPMPKDCKFCREAKEPGEHLLDCPYMIVQFWLDKTKQL